MRESDIKRGLDEVRKNFAKILAPDAPSILDDAKVQVESKKRRFEELTRRTDNPNLTPDPWGYEISPERPLRFIVTRTQEGFEAQVDIYCTVLWTAEEAPPVRQGIHLRVWEFNHAYRPEWDHKSLEAKINRNIARGLHGRVMLRCHFDKANSGQSGPEYHLQFGGDPQENELCWHPEIIKLPRFAYPPMDLVLVCDMVAYNFFPIQYQKIRKDNLWVSTIRASQTGLHKAYYDECLQALSDGKMLLDHLWNIS